jgi:methylphosphotriester-DNA--protein-cysteine methyltransferase
MDMIASKLGLSRQTLFRKLKAEGVTFAKVLDELRHKMALHYLSGKKVSVNETAYLVGSPVRPRSLAHSSVGPTMRRTCLRVKTVAAARGTAAPKSQRATRAV